MGCSSGTMKKRQCAKSLALVSAKNEITLLYANALKVEKLLVNDKVSTWYTNKHMKK